MERQPPAAAAGSTNERHASPAKAQTGGRTLIAPAAFGAIALAIITFVTSFLTPADYDYWWHLADGRYMVHRHALPVPDPFSFTAAGRPLVAHEWLAELSMYALHQAAGIRGPVALFALAMVAVVLLSLNTLRRIGLGQGAALALLCLMLAALHMFTGPRPQVLGFAFAAALLWLLERWILRKDGSIWALPLLIWLWGNIHGSFAIGLALPVLVLAGELLASSLNWRGATRLESGARLQLALATAASLPLLVLNPNGLALLTYPLSKLHDPLARQYLGEWSAMDISSPGYWPFLLLAGGYLALVVLRRPRLPASDLVLATALIGLSLSTVKYAPFATVVLTLLLGRVLAQPSRGDARLPAAIARFVTWQSRRRYVSAAASMATQALYLIELAVLAAVLVFTLRHVDPMAAVRGQMPVAAVDALGAQGLEGPLFHDYNWGGYLIWRLWPQTRVFVDGRGDIFIRGGELRRYFDVVELRPDADAVLDRYEIRTVLFPRDSALVRYLLAGGQWRLTYDDGRVVALKRTPRGIAPSLSQ